MEPIGFQEACLRVREKLHIRLGTERIKTEESLGRIISENVFSNMDNPPFNRSTMDGFAVRASDTEGASDHNPVILKLSGESRIGENPPSLRSPFSALRISTGAKIPIGADSVVMVENTALEDGNVKIFREVEQGENIAHRGGDLINGELILKAGTVIDIPHIAVMNALGIQYVPVKEMLKIGIVSTGSELIMPGTPYKEPKIFDSNGPTIQAILNSYSGISADYLGTLDDDRALIDGKLRDYLREYHIVIVSGGSSAGEYDYVYRIISELNPGMLFHGVMIKPGMPTAFGQHDCHFIIGLPGFPVSALMVLLSLFMSPILSIVSSDGVDHNQMGKIGISIRVDSRKTNLIPVKILGTGSEARVYPVKGLSGSVSRFLDTDGYIIIPPRNTELQEGESVDIYRFTGRTSSAGKVISGIIDRDVSDWLRARSIEYNYRRLAQEDAISAFSNGSVDGIAIDVDDAYLTELLTDLRKKVQFSSNEISYRPVFSVSKKKTEKNMAALTAVTEELSPWNILSGNGVIAELSERIKNSTGLRLPAEEAFRQLASGEVGEIYTTVKPPENLSFRNVAKVRKMLLMRE